MSSDSKDEPFPAVSPENALILMQLAVRYHGLFAQRKADNKLRAEIQTRIEAANSEIKKLITAATALGADPNKVGWFRSIRDAAGAAIFDRTMADAGFFIDWGEGSVPPTVSSEPAQKSTFQLPPTASVRDLVLERLDAAGTTGALASQIRKSIETLRGAVLHEKTIGMTLYRLSRDGLARREGRTWFFVPEAKNPGAGTPGLFNRED